MNELEIALTCAYSTPNRERCHVCGSVRVTGWVGETHDDTAYCLTCDKLPEDWSLTYGDR